MKTDENNTEEINKIFSLTSEKKLSSEIRAYKYHCFIDLEKNVKHQFKVLFKIFKRAIIVPRFSQTDVKLEIDLFCMRSR